MPSDRARVTFDPSRKWRSLIAQQGRVTVEADFNEAMMISAAYRRQVVLEVVGPVGTPMSPAGYAVTVIGGDNAGIPGDLTIGAGALYVSGERLDLDKPVTYSSQPEWLDSSTDPSGLWVAAGAPYGTGSGYELIYLLAPEQEVSAVEDPALADVALGGPDTMQRSRILQRFVRQTISAAPDSSASPTDWWTLLTGSASTSVFGGLTLDSTGTLLVSTTTLEVSFAGGQPADPAPAGPGSTAGYLGAENQLIRVMVLPTAAPAEGGPPPPSIVWGFDDASFVYRVQSLSYDAATDATVVTLASAPVDSYHQPVVGQSVDLLRDAVGLDAGAYIASATGYMASVVTAYDPTTLTLAIAGSPPADYLPAVLTTPPPTVAAVGPCVGIPAGGTTVTVIGSGFTGATQVTFGANAAANLIVLNDTQLTVTSPAGVAAVPPASPQPVDVQVTTPAGSSSLDTDLDGFTYVAPGAPTIAPVPPSSSVPAVSPSSGVPAGGTLVTITGSGFTVTTAVEFGSTPGLGLVIDSDTQLTVLTPPAVEPGTVGVTVITTAGEATDAAAFEYVTTATAQVTAVTPSTGGPQVQTAVAVTGSGFTGATGVNFGEIAATKFSVVSDTELTAVSPAPGATGTVDVLVTTAAGISSPNPPDQFTYVIGVTGATPSSGPLLGGTEVAVTGIGLSGANSVLFGATAAPAFSVVSDTALTVIAPPGAGTVHVTVTTAAGATATVPADRFVYEPTPQPYLRVWQGLGAATTVASSAPANSYAFALEGTGTVVTLSSPSGWFHGGDFWRFALRPLAPDSVDPPRYLDAGQRPDGPRTLICPLAVLDWAGGTATVQTLVPQFGDLTYLTELVLQHITVPAPTVTSLSPAVGSPTGGTVVTVTGTGFTGATAVSFGNLLGTAVKVISDTQLTVTSPAQSVDTVGVTVTAPTGTSAAGTQFAYVAVTGVSPAVGPPTGGTAVTLTGSGFADATAANFGGTPGTGFAVTSDTEITVTTPAGNGLVDITVSVPLGTSPTGSADLFLYGEVNNVQPPSGPVSGGTHLTIDGSGFAALPITAVTFGSASVAATVNSDSALTVFTPATGTPGEVTVTVFTQLGALPVTNPQGSQFQYTGKTLIKDAVDVKNLNDGGKNIRDKAVGDAKIGVLEKTHDVFTSSGKVAEAKPAETALTGVGLTQPPDLVDTTAAGAGQAFIAQEERPAVGEDLLNDG